MPSAGCRRKDGLGCAIYRSATLFSYGYLLHDGTKNWCDCCLFQEENQYRLHPNQTVSPRPSRSSRRSMHVWSSHKARVWINRVRLPILLVGGQLNKENTYLRACRNFRLGTLPVATAAALILVCFYAHFNKLRAESMVKI